MLKLEEVVTNWPLLCLTISQPHADKIKRKVKFVENRPWWTNHRGQIGIHAGKGTQYLSKDELQHFEHGGIIAVANVVTCTTFGRLEGAAKKRPDWKFPGTGITLRMLAEHEHTKGPFCLVLNKVIPVQFVPWPGRQKLWEFQRP